MRWQEKVSQAQSFEVTETLICAQPVSHCLAFKVLRSPTKHPLSVCAQTIEVLPSSSIHRQDPRWLMTKIKRMPRTLTQFKKEKKIRAKFLFSLGSSH